MSQRQNEGPKETGEKKRMPTHKDSRLMSDEEWLNERFWPKVDRSGDCWIWLGCTDPKAGRALRYGRVIYKGKKQKPHRVIKAIADRIPIEAIPKQLQACHKCDNPLCVNPDHIFWGSSRDNHRDSIRKGRHVSVTRRKSA